MVIAKATAFFGVTLQLAVALALTHFLVPMTLHGDGEGGRGLRVLAVAPTLTQILVSVILQGEGDGEGGDV